MKKTKINDIYLIAAVIDKEAASTIARRLFEAGIESSIRWYSEPALGKLDSREGVIRRASQILVVLSEYSIYSSFMAYQVGMALSLEIPTTAILVDVKVSQLPAVMKKLGSVEYARLDDYVATLTHLPYPKAQDEPAASAEIDKELFALRRMMRKRLLTRGATLEETDDALGAATLELLEHAAQFNNKTEARALFVRTANREHAQIKREQARRQTQEYAYYEEKNRPNRGYGVSDASLVGVYLLELKARIADALSSLQQPDREIVMKKIRGLTVEEIAHNLDLTPSAVRRIYCRSLARLVDDSKILNLLSVSPKSKLTTSIVSKLVRALASTDLKTKAD